MGQFSIDVDPESITFAGVRLTELGNHLAARAAHVRSAPQRISAREWSGHARRAIDAEVTALGDQLAGFSPRFTSAGAALASLAATVRTAVDITVPGLNRRWDAATQTYESAVRAANARLDADAAGSRALPGTPPDAATLERRATLDSELADAATSLRDTQSALIKQHQALIGDLHAAFRAAGQALADACLVPVSPKALWAYKAPSFGALHWVHLDVRKVLGASLHLYDRRRASSDAATIAHWAKQMHESTPGSRTLAALEDMHRLLVTNNSDKTFATELMTQLGPKGLLELTSHLGGRSRDELAQEPDPRGKVRGLLGAMQVELGNALATATFDPDAAGQVSRQWIQELVHEGGKTFSSVRRDDTDGLPSYTYLVEAYGYQWLGVLLHSGRYGTEFLHTVGTGMVHTEKQMAADKGHGEGIGAIHWTAVRDKNPASARLNWIAGVSPEAHAGYDPLDGLMVALRANPDGARAFFADGARGDDLPMVDYLATYRSWPPDLMTTEGDRKLQDADRSLSNPQTSGGRQNLAEAIATTWSAPESIDRRDGLVPAPAGDERGDAIQRAWERAEARTREPQVPLWIGP